MSKKCNNSIKCDVESCKHQNTDKQECELDEIKVSCVCDNDDCTCSSDTICDSFESIDEDNIDE